MKTEARSFILIVEDEIVKRVVLRVQLDGLGQIGEAKNMDEAEALIDNLAKAGTPPSVAVVDLQMPNREGFDPDAGFKVAEKLEKAFSEVPVIILTVRNDAEAWAQAKSRSNLRFFFTKPWESAKLRAAVTACIERKAQGLQIVGQVEGVDND